MPREPALRNTCQTSVERHQSLSSDIPPAARFPPHRPRPTGYPPNRQSATVGAEGRSGKYTTSSRTTTGAAPELKPPKSACAGDTVLRTSTRGTVPIGLCAGCKMSQHIRIGPEPVLTAHAPSKLRKKPMVDSNFSLI